MVLKVSVRESYFWFDAPMAPSAVWFFAVCFCALETSTFWSASPPFSARLSRSRIRRTLSTWSGSNFCNRSTSAGSKVLKRESSVCRSFCSSAALSNAASFCAILARSTRALSYVGFVYQKNIPPERTTATMVMMSFIRLLCWLRRGGTVFCPVLPQRVERRGACGRGRRCICGFRSIHRTREIYSRGIDRRSQIEVDAVLLAGDVRKNRACDNAILAEEIGLKRDGIDALRDHGHIYRQALVFRHLKTKGLECNRLQSRLFECLEKNRRCNVRREHAVCRMHAVVEAGELLDERRLESRLRTLELREFCGVLGRQVLPIEEDPDGKCRGCDKNDDRDEQQQIIEPAAAPQGRTRDRRVVRYERSWYAGINHSLTALELAQCNPDCNHKTGTYFA